MMLYWLQQSGNKPITLMGGGTTRVGDPSGKDETRTIRPVEEIDANKESIKGVFAKILKFGAGKTDAVMLDNAEWLTQAQLHRHAARRRPAFLGQPHAEHGLGRACGWSASRR